MQEKTIIYGITNMGLLFMLSGRAKELAESNQALLTAKSWGEFKSLVTKTMYEFYLPMSEYYQAPDEPVKELSSTHIAGLKNALNAERESRRKLSEQLKELMTKAEKGSELEQELAKNAFSPHTWGCTVSNKNCVVKLGDILRTAGGEPYKNSSTKCIPSSGPRRGSLCFAVARP